MYACLPNYLPTYLAEQANSVTSKKLPNVYKSCQNMISLEKW